MNTENVTLIVSGLWESGVGDVIRQPTGQEGYTWCRKRLISQPVEYYLENIM